MSSISCVFRGIVAISSRFVLVIPRDEPRGVNAESDLCEYGGLCLAGKRRLWLKAEGGFLYTHLDFFSGHRRILLLLFWTLSHVVV